MKFWEWAHEHPIATCFLAFIAAQVFLTLIGIGAFFFGAKSIIDVATNETTHEEHCIKEVKYFGDTEVKFKEAEKQLNDAAKLLDK